VGVTSRGDGCVILPLVSRYFVTGATGFVGAEVAKQLRTRGHQVVALVRSPEKASLLAKLGCELHVGDITAPETLRAGMRGADGVFHLAAWYRTGAPRARALAHAVNVEGTRHVLAVMRELGIARGVYTSSLVVFSDTHGAVVDERCGYDGPHLTVYNESKWRAHYEVALPAIAAGLPLIILLPGVVYGPGDTSAVRGIFVDHLRRRLPFVPTRTAWCWAHVDDTAHAHIEAMERGRVGECYIVAGPAHTVRDAVRAAARASGRPAPLAGIPPLVLRGLARLMSGIETFVALPPGLSGETLRAVAGTTWLGSSAKAALELGFAPRPLDEGLRHLIEHEMRGLGMAPRQS
jgi:nucleoside-diphosphate-sugar epimerase